VRIDAGVEPDDEQAAQQRAVDAWVDGVDRYPIAAPR
jgi:hypothetical protein